MHYYIDGYNLLFRMNQSQDRLESQREQIIEELNTRLGVAKIDATIVFDAAFQLGGRSRSHYNHLEILYTSYGETADELIIEEIKNAENPRQEIVVTSDKNLALQVRGYSAKTVEVREFMLWLDKVYKKNLKGKVKEKKKDKFSIEPKPKPEVEKSAKSVTAAATDDLIDYYDYIFEARFKELPEEERPKPRKKVVQESKEPKRKKKSPFEEPVKEVDAADEMERWLKLFEEREQEG